MIKLFEIIKEANNWQDIHQRLMEFNVQNDKPAGKIFEEFCKYYYLTEPTVKNDYKNVWLFRDLPNAIKIQLGLGKVDHGVDLVLEGHDNALSVVQCKFKNDQSSKISWTKDRLSNLFAEGTKSDYLIVFTNAAGIDKHSETKERLSIVTAGDLIAMSEKTIEQIKSLANGNPIEPLELKKPRDYQNEAISNVIRGFEDNDRGQLILPCGAGKTLVSLWIRESLNAKHTLVLVPSLALLRQIKNEWTANSHYAPRICVCSEKDIDTQNDSIFSNVNEISGKVTTNYVEIWEFLKSNKKSIVYSTYQSLNVVSEAIKGTDFQFDLAICDEAHKTAGRKRSRYGLVHLDSNVPIKKRLYMTATPRVLSTTLCSVLTEEEANFIQDMSNPSVYGPEFHRMSFKEAIDKEILVDYQIVAIGVTDLELKHALKQRKYVTDHESIDEIANNYALDKFMNKYGSTHAITFHSSIKKAKLFMDRHTRLYDSTITFHVNGTQTTDDRNRSMKDFENSQRSVMTNARCLTEGVDVPVIDAVFFCDPKNSKIDIVQATGRALRRADHKVKKFGYVIVPIYHCINENIEEVIAASPFKALIGIIRALSSHDERLTDEIKKIQLGKNERGSISDHISILGKLNLIMLEGFEKALEDGLYYQIIKNQPVSYRDFSSAREYVHTLGLTGKSGWSAFCQGDMKPRDIPVSPFFVYKDTGWSTWGNWLGTGNIAPGNNVWRPFEDARKFVQSLNLRGQPAWRKYAKSGNKPADIPANPDRSYKDKGWISMGDWLGTGSIAPSNMILRPFYEAKKYVHSLNLKNRTKWRQYVKSGNKPSDIPSDPNKTYKNDGWISMGDWLGTGNIASYKMVFLPFSEARTFVHTLKIPTKLAWEKYSKSGSRPKTIHGEPDIKYKDNGWISWGDWLGTETIAQYKKVFRQFEEARNFVHSLNLKTPSEWALYAKSGKKPVDIPYHPNRSYKKDGWNSMEDWLGTEQDKN